MPVSLFRAGKKPLNTPEGGLFVVLHREMNEIDKKETKCTKIDKNEISVYLVICLKREPQIGIIKLTYLRRE